MRTSRAFILRPAWSSFFNQLSNQYNTKSDLCIVEIPILNQIKQALTKLRPTARKTKLVFASIRGKKENKKNG